MVTLMGEYDQDQGGRLDFEPVLVGVYMNTDLLEFHQARNIHVVLVLHVRTIYQMSTRQHPLPSQPKVEFSFLTVSSLKLKIQARTSW